MGTLRTILYIVVYMYIDEILAAELFSQFQKAIIKRTHLNGQNIGNIAKNKLEW